ncbi:hypothetical protein Cadr_000016851 [Camelus dromedarius]|uniref:Uncharacterized protein n=1 Tax=Camelus dromedarius TaxID=9838 RepID=A0A5N4DHG2_CAMDR|nr:hypothetical protein Cadr_000016851 [Camelus dromedarius]
MPFILELNMDLAKESEKLKEEIQQEPHYSTPGLAAREANGGAPEGAEGSVGLTAANNSKVSQQINNMHKL